MRGIHELLTEYGESHQNPVNKRLHWICVPSIMWSLLGLLWMVPIPAGSLTLNCAIIIVLLAMVYYLRVSPGLAVGILPVLTAMIAIIHAVERTGVSLPVVCISVFVLAWTGQFIGHSIEGKRPSFFQDVQFLLIGPLWLLAFVYRRLGIRY